MKELIQFKQIIILFLALIVISCEKSENTTKTEDKEFVLLIENGGLSISPDERINYSATLVSKDGLISNAENITWSVTPDTMAVIDANGNLTPKKTGNAVVSAKINKDGHEYTATAPLGIYVNSLFVVAPSAIIFHKGGELQLEVVHFTTEANVTYNFVSSNTSVATVNSEGVVSFIDNGDCYIEVKASNVPESPFIVPVMVISAPEIQLPVSRIEVNKTAVDLFKTETFKLEAKAYNLDGQVNNVDFEWKSQNSSIAEVSSEGVITPKQTGETKIKVSAEGVFSYVDVLVNPDTVLIVSPFIKSIKTGESYQFTATCYKNERNVPLFNAEKYDINVKWVMPDYGPGFEMFNIGSVDNNGIVTINNDALPGMNSFVFAYDESNPNTVCPAIIFVDMGFDFPGF